MKKITLRPHMSLKPEAAERCAAKIGNFGGSVGAFASLIVTELSKLPVEEIHRTVKEIADRARVFEQAQQIHDRKKA